MIPITKPYFTKDEYNAFKRPLDSGWVSQGPVVVEFEKAFAEMSGAPFAAASTSCTTALHLALAALGVGHGDEVVVPSYTFVATAAAVEYTGAKPVFCDVLPGTYNIDPEDFARKITKRTKAVIPVHLFGLCANMDAVMKIARKHRLFVIEDAACATGSKYKGKHAGTIGNCGCFSFHPRKIITTGEGGMLTTHAKSLYDKVVCIRSQGASVSDLARHKSGGFALPEFNVLGYNYRMTDLQAAMGVTQLAKLGRIIELRQKKADVYFEILDGIKGMTLPAVPEECVHTYQSYVIVLAKGIDRNAVGAEMERRGIATRQGTHAVHMLGYYRKKYGLKPGDCPVSKMLNDQAMAIPLYPRMTLLEQREVAEQLEDVIRKLG